MPKLRELRSGEIYRFPIEDGTAFAYVRVVLKGTDLDIEFGNPLFFVSQEDLLQVSKCRQLDDDAFRPENLLVNGKFIRRAGPWSKHGWEKVGERPLRIEEVEMPCFGSTMDNASGKAVHSLCRGEVQYPFLNGKTPNDVGCFLCMGSPEGLRAYLLVEDGELRLQHWFWRCDGRFSPEIRSLLPAVGIDLEVPYFKLLSSNRLRAYENAIRATGGS